MNEPVKEMNAVVGGESLIPSFYELISRRGPVTREEFEADTTSLLPAWRLPYFDDWISVQSELNDWKRDLIEGVMEYESRRLRFVNGMSRTSRGGPRRKLERLHIQGRHRVRL